MKSSALIFVLFIVSLMASTPVYRNPNTESSDLTISYPLNFMDTITVLREERQLATLKTRQKQREISLILKSIEDETIPDIPVNIKNIEPFTDIRTYGILPIRKEASDTLR